MSQPRRRSGSRRPAAARRPGPLDVWSPPAELPPVERITVPEEVGALLRSLGEPPAIDGSMIASGYFTAVVERAAAIAAALALSADLLEMVPGEG
jgi:hypothetical protein